MADGNNVRVDDNVTQPDPVINFVLYDRTNIAQKIFGRTRLFYSLPIINI